MAYFGCVFLFIAIVSATIAAVPTFTLFNSGPASGRFLFVLLPASMPTIHYLTTAEAVATAAAHFVTLPRIGIDLEFDDMRHR